MSHKSGLDVTLEIERLGYTTARGDTLVEDISFHVHTGEILAIAGPNGAGKSTLVRMIAGLMPAASGEIRARRTLAERHSPRRKGKVHCLRRAE